MKLSTLAYEYQLAAQQLSGRLSHLRKLRECSSGEQAELLTQRIDALTIELTDVKLVARYLEEYYGN